MITSKGSSTNCGGSTGNNGASTNNGSLGMLGHDSDDIGHVCIYCMGMPG